MKTAEDFKRQAKLKNIVWWGIHECSMCGYGCGYKIDGDNLYYDNGCDCSYGGGPEPRNWENLASHYNMQSSEKYKKEMDKFWGFK